MINEYQVVENNTLADDIRQKLEDAKQKAKNCFYKTVRFVISHPDQAAAIAITGLWALKKADKYIDIYRENRLRNSMIYDRSLGMYWETRKPLTTNQRLTIESRHKAGEPYGQILSDMKILKR